VTDEPPVVEYDADAPPFRTLHYMKTQQEVVETIDMCDDLKNSLQCSSDEMIATLLLNLFVMDYLGRENLSSKVFVEQQRQLLNPHPPVTLHRKCGAVILIVGANTVFLTYVILQNLSRENSYQASFLVLYCIQFAVEFFWYEALICVWMFYSIPLIISREVQTAISCLRECANKAFVHPDDICQDALNATHWFYVSTRMAEQFSHMLESQCVLAYHTYYRELATDRVAKSVKLEKDYFYDLTIVAQVSGLFKSIGALPLEIRKGSLYFFQLCVAFGLFGVAAVTQHHILWIFPVVGVVLYEIVMWTIYIYTRNAVYTEKALFAENDLEEEASSVGDSDGVGDDDTNDEILLDIGIGSARNFNEERDQESDLDDLVVLEQNMNQIFNSALLEMMNKADERKSRMLNEDSMYQSIGLQRSSAVNLEDSVDEGDVIDEFVQSPHSMFMSQRSSSFLREDRNETRPFHNSWAGGRSPQKKQSLKLQSRSLFGAGSYLNDGSVVSTQNSTFIKPKRNRLQKPQRVEVKGGYKSDDSSSDGSAVELNEIFDNFFNSDEQKQGGGGDDDSVEDYQLMMSTFDFKDHDDESVDDIS
jgi:hypothetical protein